MPYLIHDPRDVHAYRPADQSERGAFYVSESTAANWGWECRNGHRPTNWAGLPLRPMPSGIYRDDEVVEGIFVDWQSDITRERMFIERRRAVVDQPTHPQLATVFGPFQHNLHPYRAADCWARRVDRSQARGGQPRDPRAADYRRYSTSRWSRTALRQVAGSQFRCFGIELEFDTTGDATRIRRDIAVQARAAGMTFVERWAHYGRDMSIAGWQGTYDSSLGQSVGGEIISDILDGSAAAHDEVRDMARTIRSLGGQASRRQGTHVHHDCRDYTLDDKVRLVSNLSHLQNPLHEFVPAFRRSATYSRLMGDYEFADTLTLVRQGRNPRNEHYQCFNFGHLFEASARVEFRGMGYSLNGAKLRTWIKVGQAIMAATKAGETWTVQPTVPEMLATLRQHGLSRWAADEFATRTGHLVAA